MIFRMPWTYRKWEEELRFLEQIDSANPGSHFGHDRLQFQSYCESLCRLARRDGFDGIAERLHRLAGETVDAS